MNENTQPNIKAIQAARLERRKQRHEKLSDALPKKLAQLDSEFASLDAPSKADKRKLEADKLAEAMKAIEILTMAIIRKIEIQRNIAFSCHDQIDAKQAAFLAATEFGFFTTPQTSPSLYAAISRAIYNGLGINKTWELGMANETLLEAAEQIEDETGENCKVYLSLNSDSIMPILEAAFTSDTRKRRKAIFKAKVSFLEGCLSYAQGGAADIISRSGFRTAKQEFMEYIEKGILQLKLTSLEDYWQKA